MCVKRNKKLLKNIKKKKKFENCFEILKIIVISKKKRFLCKVFFLLKN